MAAASSCGSTTADRSSTIASSTFRTRPRPSLESRPWAPVKSRSNASRWPRSRVATTDADPLRCRAWPRHRLRRARRAETASSRSQSRQPSSAPAVTVPVATAGPTVAAALPEPPKATSATAVPARGWAVQLGAFAQESNADALAGRTAALLAFVDNPADLAARAPRVERDGGVFRVLVGSTVGSRLCTVAGARTGKIARTPRDGLAALTPQREPRSRFGATPRRSSSAAS